MPAWLSAAACRNGTSPRSRTAYRDRADQPARPAPARGGPGSVHTALILCPQPGGRTRAPPPSQRACPPRGHTPAQVGAELEGAGEERAGPGAGDQVEHLGDVRGSEHDGLGIWRTGFKPGAVHLDAGDGALQVPAWWRFRVGRRARRRRRPARPARRGRPRRTSVSSPRAVAAVLCDGGERGHVHRVARRSPAALRHVRLWVVSAVHRGLSRGWATPGATATDGPHFPQPRIACRRPRAASAAARRFRVPRGPERRAAVRRGSTGSGRWGRG